MRLNAKEHSVITSTILQLDPNARIFLFGSRVDDKKKGGDIDLLVFSSTLTFQDKLKIKVLIFDQIEEQKVDLLIAKDDSEPFVKIAMQRAIPL